MKSESSDSARHKQLSDKQTNSCRLPNTSNTIWVFPKIGVPQKWMAYNEKPY